MLLTLSYKINSSVYWSFGLLSRFPDCSYEVWSCVCELGRHRWLTVCRWCQPNHLQYVFVEVDGEWCLCHFYFFFLPPFSFAYSHPFLLYCPLLDEPTLYLSFYHLYLSLTSLLFVFNSLFLADFSFLAMCHSYSVKEALYFTLLTTTMSHLYAWYFWSKWRKIAFIKASFPKATFLSVSRNCGRFRPFVHL